MSDWIQHWYANHFQKTFASLLIALDGINIAALEYYQQDIVQFFGPAHGPTIFSGARMLVGALIFYRAIQKKTQP